MLQAILFAVFIGNVLSVLGASLLLKIHDGFLQKMLKYIVNFPFLGQC